jgi:uncharacterized protein YecE (DUF72 family)
MSKPTHPILVGCSTWTYDSWRGPLYPADLPDRDRLGYYSERFHVVEVDSTFYRSPAPSAVRTWRSSTPEEFRFALKVPRVITHEKRMQDCEAEVEQFVSAAEQLGDKLMAGLLQFGYFNRRDFETLGDFLDLLEPFLAAWPHDRVPLAVEVRNPHWVKDELLAVLRAHGTAFTLTEQKWMPRPAEILKRLDPVTGPLSYFRLLGDREGIEKITKTWDRIVLDRSDDLVETAVVIKEIAGRVPVLVFASNHFAGYAPGTAAELRRLLGIPDPKPPERPRATLFD